MAIALTQSTKKIVTGVNNTTLAFASNVAAGALLCLSHSHWESVGAVITTPTDTLGHTYVGMTAEQGGGQQRLRSFYKENGSGGANTVTFDITGAATGDITVVVSEWSGAVTSSALDKTQVGTGSGTAVDSGATAVTAQADEMVWGAMAHDGAAMAITETGGATLVQEHEGGSTDTPIGTSFLIVASAAAFSATWTIGSSATWRAHVATFKAAEAVVVSTYRPSRHLALQQRMG